MITLRQFLGGILEEVTKARVYGDAASVRVAESYLQHDILKSFPVPRMHIKDIEVELNFGVAPHLHGLSIFEDEEVRRNIGHKIRQFLEALPDQPETKPFFAANARRRERWQSGLDGLDHRIQQALARRKPDRQSMIHVLSLAIENYFYEATSTQARHGLFSILTRAARRPHQESASVNDYISREVKEIITSVDTAEQEGQMLSDLMDLNILVEAAELEKLEPGRLQKMKLVFSSTDRKWVAAESNGQKNYLLARS